MSGFLWGVYPYVCATLFFLVPIIRLRTRPFAWSTRASGLFSRGSLGLASLLLHWGLLLVLLGHLAGLFGGLVGAEAGIRAFYWLALPGGFAVLLGSVTALGRRLVVPEVRAMSQADDYAVHLFLIPIVAIALYQVVMHRIFGVAYTASSWFASLWRLAPQPELMASAGFLTQVHVVLALTFLLYFPFTKLVHVWTYPLNYFVRPYQSMRTVRYRFQRKWELAGRSDQSWLSYGLGGLTIAFVVAGSLLGRASAAVPADPGAGAPATRGGGEGRLMGAALYVSQCARCHGVSGQGNGAGARSPTFAVPPRDLTAALYRFVSTENGVASDEDLRHTITRGLPLAGMPAFGRLSDSQVRSLVAVLDRFRAGRPRPGPSLEPPPRPGPTGATLELGGRLYAASCAACHGPEGRGDGPLAASLPSRPADLAAGAVKAGAEPEQLYLRVAAGVPPVMPAFRASRSPEEIWALVAFLEASVLPRR